MDFLKKHYEKILLGVMLVGLIGVLVFMLLFIADEKNGMTQKSMGLINPKVKELTNYDMTVLDEAADRLKQPYSLDLDTTNKLFNPMEWQRALDGSLIPARKTGLLAAVVTNITPLYTIISLYSVNTNEQPVRYGFKLERQTAATPNKRFPVTYFVSTSERTVKEFILQDVKGAPENPDSLALKLVDSGEVATVSKEQPFRRVDGYAADFRYDLERKAFHNRRVGDKVSFGGADYIVVEVNQNELILQDQSNQKKTSLLFAP